LTSFAVGLYLPEPINFSDAFKKASFSNNSAIYSTIISVVVIFLVAAILCGYKDYQDAKQTKIKVLERPDTFNNSNYFYELIFFTGKRLHSATDSSVKFRLSGDLGESDFVEIKQNNEFSNFRRGKK